MQNDKTLKEREQEFYSIADNLWACIIALTDKQPDAEARKRIQKEALGNVERMELAFSCTYGELMDARQQPKAWAFPAKKAEAKP